MVSLPSSLPEAGGEIGTVELVIHVVCLHHVFVLSSDYDHTICMYLHVVLNSA